MNEIGKRSSGNDLNIHERERFEPFRQHLDVQTILNDIAEAARLNSDRSVAETPDYFFDDTNAIDTKQMLPSRFHSFRSSASLSNDIDASANPIASDDEWREEKQQSLHNQKQQSLNGQKSHYLRQWNQPINEKFNANAHQQKQPMKTIDNNGDFMQSLDLN